MLDIILKRLKIKKSKKSVSSDSPLIQKERDESIRVSIIGKPNVGKSSLLNSLLGYNRVIVSDIAHTTREPQNTDIVYKDKQITLIDTAGISKKGQRAARPVGPGRKGLQRSRGAAAGATPGEPQSKRPGP